MAFNYARSRAKADAQIRKFGQLAKLRRAAGDRDCWALEVQLSSRERQTLKNPTNRIFLVSAVDLAVPPAKDDALVWIENGVTRVFRQDAPVSPLQPGGVVVYYELQVQG